MWLKKHFAQITANRQFHGIESVYLEYYTAAP